MSRPAAPESSEKTLVERLQGYAKQLRDSVHIHHSAADLVDETVTALSLAQTEIKGHMRVEDELRVELDAHKTVIGLLFESLPECPRMGDLPEYVDDMKARIAELEKDAARYRFLAEQHNDWHVERWVDTMRGSGTWQSIRGTALGNAIDAALKSRA